MSRHCRHVTLLVVSDPAVFGVKRSAFMMTVRQRLVAWICITLGCIIILIMAANEAHKTWGGLIKPLKSSLN